MKAVLQVLSTLHESFVSPILDNNKEEKDHLGREPDYQSGFPLKVIHQYLNLLDFSGLFFDDAIKFYLTGFCLPGEAQKVGINCSSEISL